MKLSEDKKLRWIMRECTKNAPSHLFRIGGKLTGKKGHIPIYKDNK